MILAVVKGSQGKCRLSAYVLKRAILHFYSKGKLFPKGVVAELESVQDWALKTGKALRRLVNWLYKSTLFLFSVCFFFGEIFAKVLDVGDFNDRMKHHIQYTILKSI